ncbi:MCE family protein [Sciscionella marina]|uniref:MCE family protein n=1 Tax=Sciscionella marina TaxID=508770 RepID=UPI0009FCB817|nr:MCE family protein [Sciscionella marina]
MTRKSAIAIRGDLTRLSILAVICALVLAALAVQLSQTTFGSTKQYKAAFGNVMGLSAGNAVEIAGVKVGSVEDIELHDGKPTVAFSIEQGQYLPESVHANIRYRNLTGDRYLDLTRGSGVQTPMKVGATIPVGRTKPALDLDTLLNGFQPLFQGLQPKQVNAVAGELIAVFQGQGQTVQGLLAHLGSLTNNLAGHDQLIGKVIDNLNTVLGTVNQHGGEFSMLLNKLQALVSGLASDRKPIGQSLGKVADLTGTLTDTLKTARPPLKETINQSGRLLKNVDADKGYLEKSLQLLPVFYTVFDRIGNRGSFTNAYACGIRVRLSGVGDKSIYTPWLMHPTDRCGRPGKP